MKDNYNKKDNEGYFRMHEKRATERIVNQMLKEKEEGSSHE